MRITSVSLSWFRGAADPVALECNCKSIVVYGANGAGKSSFVDAIEYAINNGRIEHLAHEYSGRRQEKGLRNTHAPANEKARLSIKFKDDSEHTVQIGEDGSSTITRSDTAAISSWEYRRIVLRQDEVSHFIHARKGEKYSALLPLLGIGSMEVAAENLHQLARTVDQAAGVDSLRIKAESAATKRKEVFGTASDEEILGRIKTLHSKYCPDVIEARSAFSQCEEVRKAIDCRIAASDADQRRYVALKDAAMVDLKGSINATRIANGRLAGAVDPLIAQKLEVLESAARFVAKLESQKEITCPACGQSIPVEVFQEHIAAEQLRLQETIKAFDTRRAAVANVCDKVRSLQLIIKKSDLKLWRDAVAKEPLLQNLNYLERIDTEALRAACGEDELQNLQREVQPFIDIAMSSSKNAPLGAQELSTDKQIVEAVLAMITAKSAKTELNRALTLKAFIESLEHGIRDEIRSQAKQVIESISSDVQIMWRILHPNEPIDHVHLYQPDGADKAIDVGLKFHGVKQESPRLTLSEGCRNSLGLCIFLAMAKREAANDRPIVLDDVVVSFDRNHRGMVAEILEKELGGRQVMLLTHDRDWYIELKAQLDAAGWDFKVLLPYEAPSLGIRWSHKNATFDDARALLKDRPDAAGNDARKIMDVELSTVAEKLRIKFAFLRGDKNDKRMAHDFLQQIGSDGKKCFQRKVGTGYECCIEANAALEVADKLLLSWGNRASHTMDLVIPEAAKLIEACEKALSHFTCLSCGKRIWFADASTQECVQCQCGNLRWRYGRG